MKRKLFIFSIFFCTIIFVGAGCDNNTQEETVLPPDTNVQEEEKEEPKEKPPTTEELQHAYRYCIEQNQDTLLRYDESSRKTKLFCVVDEEFECDAFSFMEGSCPKDKSELEREEPLFIDDKECTTDVQPVCGQDGFSYINACVARREKVEIKKEGQCDGPPPTVDTEQNSDGITERVSPRESASLSDTDIRSTISAIGVPAWVDVLVDIVSYESTKEHTNVEACQYGTEQYYLKASTCPTCFSVLYNDVGETVCYPDNDLQDKCPAEFDKQNRSGSCSVLWRGN